MGTTHLSRCLFDLCLAKYYALPLAVVFLLLIFIIFFHSAITDESLRNAIITQMLSSREVITRHYLQLQGVATAEAAKGALDILAPCLAQLVQNTPATEFISTE